MDPATLQRLIRSAFSNIIDRELMDEVIAREETDRARLRKALRKVT